MDAVLTQSEVGIATLLAFLRFASFFAVAPLPGGGTPMVIRIILAASVAWAFAPASPWATSDTPLLAAVVSEVILGLAMGMLLTMAFYSFVVAGEGVGHQMGLGTPAIIDPSLPGQYTVMGGAFLYIALGIFALVGGPGQMLVLLQRSVEVLPPGEVMQAPDSLEIVVVGGSELFKVALQAAAPLIAAVFCAQMLLAVLARAVPTMNLFIEGPGLTVGTGVLGLIAVVHTFVPLVQEIMIQRMEQLARWLLPL